MTLGSLNKPAVRLLPHVLQPGVVYQFRLCCSTAADPPERACGTTSVGVAPRLSVGTYAHLALFAPLPGSCGKCHGPSAAPAVQRAVLSPEVHVPPQGQSFAQQLSISCGGGGGLTPPPSDPDFIVGKNEILQQEILIWRFLVHKFLDFWAPDPPP